jgi:glycosyltransferase involved in cell wall biosynthesis
VEVRVFAPPQAAYAPLLRARQVAVEPWTNPGVGELAGLRELRRSLALFQPDVVLLRGAAVTIPSLLSLAGSSAPVVVFFDLFEGDTPPGFLLRTAARPVPVARVVFDLPPQTRQPLAIDTPVTLIPPGHDPAWYPDQPALSGFGIPERAFTVGVVAAGVGDDSLPLIIDAARWLPMDFPIHFLLLAPPEDHNDLGRQVRRNPLPQRFHLVDDFSNAPGLMAGCNLFVALGWGSEPIRRSLMHCLHKGVPCIAEDGALTRQVINPGVAGLLVPRHDPGAVAHALSGFYEQPAQRESLRLGAAREAAARFTMGRVLQQTRELLDGVIASDKG